MYINLESDYAVRILIDLCRNHGRIDAGALAKHTGVTQRFALKILRKLVEGKLVKSYKGVHGGYELLVRPEEISLLQVIELVEGRYYFSRCLLPEYEKDEWCEAKECKVNDAYAKISKLVREQLSAVSFDQLL